MVVWPTLRTPHQKPWNPLGGCLSDGGTCPCNPVSGRSPGPHTASDAAMASCSAAEDSSSPAPMNCAHHFLPLVMIVLPFCCLSRGLAAPYQVCRQCGDRRPRHRRRAPVWPARRLGLHADVNETPFHSLPRDPVPLPSRPVKDAVAALSFINVHGIERRFDICRKLCQADVFSAASLRVASPRSRNWRM